jgi:hypothetical protein
VKKFVLTLTAISRLDQTKIIIAVIAKNGKEARIFASKYTTPKLPEGTVWLDPKKTSCRGRKTKCVQKGIESVKTIKMKSD